jgi:hypothetical protein
LREAAAIGASRVYPECWGVERQRAAALTTSAPQRLTTSGATSGGCHVPRSPPR